VDISAAGLEELEREVARSWRAPEEERLGGWLLRAGEGFTGRANSALAAGAPGLPLADAVETVRHWYAARGLPPMVAVPYPLGRPEASAVDRFLAGRGWTVRPGAATVMVTALAAEGLPAPAGPPGVRGAEVRVEPEPGDDWLRLYRYRGQDLPPIARRLLLSAPWQGFGSIRDDGRVIATGRVAGAGDWAGLTAVEVHPAYRRRGLASAVTAALAAHAAGQGATGLYLQVEDGNTGARALYRRVGFTGHHGYHYRVAP
jgi:N-acetylglutamate synthase